MAITPITPTRSALPGETVLVSAHRGGCGRDPRVENTWAAFQAAVRMPCEYIEFDVQRTADGAYVIHHDHCVTINGRRVRVEQISADTLDTAVGRRVRLTEVLDLLREHDKKAHLDLKFTSPAAAYATPAATFEVEVARIVADNLPDGAFVFTTVEDKSVRALRDWADQAGVPMLCGLTVGRRLHGLGLWSAVATRFGEVFPGPRIRRSRANLVVAQRHLARFRLLSWAHKRGLPVLVWTVDNQTELRRLLADERVWLVTSNRPMDAVALRWARLGGRRRPGLEAAARPRSSAATVQHAPQVA
jgi:glycerophosphoryl diester phosphodiesterase